MSRPLILPSFFKEKDFKLLYQKYGQRKFGVRLLAFCYLQQGQGVKETARRMHKSEPTIRHWINLYLQKGLEGLLSISFGRGRHSKLSSANEAQLKFEISKLSSSLKWGRLRAFEIGKLIEQQFGVSYSSSGIYALLHRLSYSWITVRSIHPKANLRAQEIFKK